jgi:hypothetical protein
MQKRFKKSSAKSRANSRRTRTQKRRRARAHSPSKPAPPSTLPGETTLANYQQAFRSGLRLQEQAMQLWSRMLAKSWLNNIL